MNREKFKKELKKHTYSHFTWQKNSFKIDGNGNLLQLNESKQKEEWNHVDTGRLGENQMKSIIAEAKKGAIII